MVLFHHIELHGNYQLKLVLMQTQKPFSDRKTNINDFPPFESGIRVSKTPFDFVFPAMPKPCAAKDRSCTGTQNGIESFKNLLVIFSELFGSDAQKSQTIKLNFF